MIEFRLVAIPLTLHEFKAAAVEFASDLSANPIEVLYGVTDGKAVGTYVESELHVFLAERFDYVPGNAASGIDVPELNLDLKVTSIRQPQSSSPFSSARQKVYGLGHSLLVFVYEKADDHLRRAADLKIRHLIHIEKEYTADFQLTKGLLGLLANGATTEEVAAFLEERNLPLDEIGRDALAAEILEMPPIQGYLTVSNALQWRLQYGRAITLASSGGTTGLESLL